MDEKKTRELLLVYLGNRCCVGTKPARTWKFKSLLPRKSYVASLSSFVQIRRVVLTREPYFGGPLSGYRDFDMWDVDTTGKEPNLFENKEAVIEVPKSDRVEDCDECSGAGTLPCSSCRSSQIILRPNSEDNNKPCGTCHELRVVKCNGCNGAGALLIKRFVIVSWITVTVKSILRGDSWLSVPDEKILQSIGKELLTVEDSIITPVSFSDNELVEQVSKDALSQRTKLSEAARTIHEKLTVSEVCIMQSVFQDEGKEFRFYILGEHQAAYLEGYPMACVDWLPFGCLLCSACKN